MYEVIVVGTDGSERAAVAVRKALDLAQLTGARLVGVHVNRPVLMTGTEVDGAAATLANEGLAEENERIRQEFLAEAGRHGVAAEIETFDGDPADALIRMAETLPADLVVVGNRGMSGVRRFVLGSVPNKVSHHCPCSLLIVDTGEG
jgi:nucleotide-binding universal stress UspA family protein